MSATLTWKVAGPQTSTGITTAAQFTDLKSLIDSKSGDSTYPWQVSSSNLGSTPYYITLKPKSGGAGRILIIQWTSAPAGANAAILDQAPGTGSIFIAYFPSGNVDTPSNLTASSGTIMGNDTGAVKCTPMVGNGTSYPSGWQWHMAMSDEACLFFTAQPSSPGSQHALLAGNILVDGSDNAYAACFGAGSSGINSLSANGVPAWNGATQMAGSNSAMIKTNYGSSNRSYFQAWSATGSWAGVAQSSTDLLSDSSNSRMYFCPIQLIGQTKGEGLVLKLRQIALGPGTIAGPFAVYNTTGPVPAAYQISGQTAGNTVSPWLTNFKL